MKMNKVGDERVGTLLLRTSSTPSDEEWQKIMDENDFIVSMEYFVEEWQ